MKKVVLTQIFFYFSLTFILCSCAATPVKEGAESSYDTFKSQEDKGLVYIVRNTKGGSKFFTKIHYIDDISVGYLGYGDGYLVIAVEPGEHTLRLRGHSGFMGSGWYEKKFVIKKGESLTIAYEPLVITPFKKEDIEGLNLGQFTALNIDKALEKIHVDSMGTEHSRIMKYFNNKDYQGLLLYTSKNKKALHIAQHDTHTYLLYVGPPELTVGKILNSMEHGLSEAIILSKIKAHKKPYKDFSLTELKALKKFGLSDAVISQMLDVTSKYSS